MGSLRTFENEILMEMKSLLHVIALKWLYASNFFPKVRSSALFMFLFLTAEILNISYMLNSAKVVGKSLGSVFHG